MWASDAFAHESGKPTQTQDDTFSVDGPREANGQDVEPPTPSVATHKTPYLAQINLLMPSDTTLGVATTKDAIGDPWDATRHYADIDM
jgi:hypothetical protein